MRFVLTYDVAGDVTEDTKACFPIEGESKDAVLSALFEASKSAAIEGRTQFEAFGSHHLTHNFLNRISGEELEQVNASTASKGVSAPVTFSVQDKHYAAITVKLLTVDEWFACAGQFATAEAA